MERAWAYVSALWAKQHPTWQVVAGEAPPGPWCKAAAVADALARADGDILVIADADVWTDGIGEAVVRLDSAAWTIPHHRVCRLDRVATAAVLDGSKRFGQTATFDRPPYMGRRGGGMVVLSRELYERVPMDRRFLGWGQEDDAWALALRAVAGREWRGLADLWHLWHKPQPRQRIGHGSEANMALWDQYKRAARTGDIQSVLAGAA